MLRAGHELHPRYLGMIDAWTWRLNIGQSTVNSREARGRLFIVHC
jgi:hypothetical protein